LDSYLYCDTSSSIDFSRGCGCDCGSGCSGVQIRRTIGKNNDDCFPIGTNPQVSIKVRCVGPIDPGTGSSSSSSGGGNSASALSPTLSLGFLSILAAILAVLLN
jgi:hypothetical protein